jgi:FKBP-type peptidyl-prolyl cis-trans isomerase FkpA
MKKLSVVMLAIVLVACSNEKETPKGYKFTVAKKGAGETIKAGQFLYAQFVLKDGKDSVWMDTQKENRPALFVLNDTANIQFEEGIEEMFRMARKGDSLVMKLEAKTLFEKTYRQQVPPNVDPKSFFTFIMKVNDVLDTAKANVLRDSLNAIAMKKYEEKRQEQLTSDIEAIDGYLAGKNIVAQQDPSGLRYVITKAGKGGKPSMSSTIKVIYKGSFLTSGEVFDQSNGPLEYPLANFIQGWQIGFQLLEKGSKATLYIPSGLGYGEQGSQGVIPPNANLVFEVELVDFK